MSSDFLRTLAARTLDASPRLAPMVPSRFAQAGPAEIDIEEERMGTSPLAPATTGERSVEHRYDAIDHGFVDRADDEVPLVTLVRPEPARNQQPDVSSSRASEDIQELSAIEPSDEWTELSAVRPEPERAELPASTRVTRIARARESLRDDVRPKGDEVRLIAEPLRPAPAVEASGRESIEEPLGPPTVVVRIGRIDVRAANAPAAPSPAPTTKRPRPSLADHLRMRDEGRR